MKFLVEQNEYIFEIKKSTFIATAIPINSEKEAITAIQNIKKLYPDARHNCSAFVVDQISRINDDGEPTNTAGKPILNALKHNDFTNTLIVVTRYFGGVKLGVGGLIRAYGQAASQVLSTSKFKIPRKITVLNLSGSINSYGQLNHFIRNNNAIITSSQFNESSFQITCEIESTIVIEFLKQFNNSFHNIHCSSTEITTL